MFFLFFRTKWKRQTAVGLELLAEAGNYAALQRLYGTSAYTWPYSNQPSAAAAAAAAALNPAAASVDLYYRQAAAAAALQKPLAYRMYPPGLPLLPTAALQQDTLRTSSFQHSAADPLRDVLRPTELRPEAPRPDTLRPEALRLDLFRPDLFRPDSLKHEPRPGLMLDVRRTPPLDDNEGPLRAGTTDNPSSPTPTDLRIRVSPDVKPQISPDVRLRVSPDVRLRSSPDQLPPQLPSTPVLRPATQLLHVEDAIRGSSP